MKQALPIYYVNLDRSVDRKNFMEKQFKEFGLQYERFPAVDGRTLALENFTSERWNYIQSAKWEFGEMARGQIGCYLSHIHLYEYILSKTNYERVVIMEDDAKITARFSELLPNIAKLPAKYGLINLCTDEHYIAKATTRTQDIDFDKDHELFEFLINNTVCCNRTSGYVIGREQIKLAFKNAFPIKASIDGYIYLPTYSKIDHIYGIRPQLIQLSDFPTDTWVDTNSTTLKGKVLLRGGSLASKIKRLFGLMFKK